MNYPKSMPQNLKFRKELLLACEASPALRKQVLERCAVDGLFWLNSFGFTIDPRRDPAKLPFITYEFQDELWSELEEACNLGRDLRIEKSRDMGVSWVTCAWMVWRMLFRRNQMFLMLSRKEDLVDGDKDSLFAHCDVLLKGLPKWMKPAIKRSKLLIDCEETESVIEGESTNSDAGRGGRRTAILWDEAAACPGGGNDIASATQANTNCRILNSTPKGESNYFAASRKTTRTFRAHWSRHPTKRRGLYKPTGRGVEVLDEVPEGYRYRDEKPPGAEGFRSVWYDAECDRTPDPVSIATELDIDYQGSDYPFFDAGKIDQLIEKFCIPALYRGDLYESGGVWKFLDDNRGPLSIWINLGVDPDGYEFPRHEQYVVACDIGQGTGASDSVAVVVNRETGVKVAEWVSNKVGVESFARIAVGLCHLFQFGDDPCLLIWDGGGPGRSFGKYVTQDLGYRRVYCKKPEDRLFVRADSPKTAIAGWFPNRELKRGLLIEYRDALASGRFINQSRKALEECKFFKNMPDGSIEHVSIASAQDGGDNHGDRVIADALACLVARPSVIAKEREEITVFQEHPYGSFGWRQQKSREDERDRWTSRW